MAGIEAVKPDSPLKKAWNKLGFKGTALAACGLAAVVQTVEAYLATDGSLRNVAYYVQQDTKADLRYYLTGGYFGTDGTRADNVILCEPAHFNTQTHQEIDAPPHLETLYSRMEQNFLQQIEGKSGHVYIDTHIALNHYKNPVVLFHKLPVTSEYDYDYKIISQNHEINQACDRLTPEQGEYLVARQRGAPIPSSKLGF